MNEESLHSVNTNEVEAGKSDDAPPVHREFGSYLRAARLAAGLVTADVAERLKLSEDIIKSLENSRIDLLPAAAFTQGYIKAYAKLLKIPSDEVMRAYDVMVPNKVAALNLNTGLPAEHSSRDVIVKVTSYVLAVLALVLFLFWLQQSGFEWSDNLVQNQDVKDPSAVEVPEPDLYPDTVLPGETEAGPAATSAITQAIPAQLPITSDKKPASIEKNLTTISPPEKKIEFKTETKVIPKPASITNDAAPALAARPEAQSSGDDIIKLQSSSESWAEVQDADNNRLFYSLLKAGNSYAIKGRAPFKIFLGNAPAVSIEVNSQLVDITRYVRQNNIAHVKISAKASTQSGGPRENVNQVIDQFVPETSASH